ncbi:MAG: trigger factor, partial [Nitrospirota bacterium]|nr:trigger factor [Nitrospirota bacterium]
MLQGIEELSPTKRKLTINVPQDVILSETNTAYNELRASAKIPGFRPGKAPHSILVKKFGKDIEAQLIEKLVPQFYMKAVQEAAIEPVSYPSIEDKIELRPGEPLSFTVTVEIKPEIRDLNFEGITLKEKPVTLDEADVERSIESMRESRALFSVTEDGLETGDMAIVDSDAYIDGQLKDELTYKEFPFVLGTDTMPKEFSDALAGKKKDETAEVKISFEADHPNKTIAGKEIVFKVSVKEAKKKHLPPLDEEFAKESDCRDMDEVKEKIRENLRKRTESNINLQYKQDILNELIKRHDFAAPESMVEGELKSLVEKTKEDAMRRGGAVKPDEELVQELVSTAKDNVKSVILLETIGKKEKVE